MKVFRLFFVCFLLTAATARGQEMATSLLPIVGHVFGSDRSRWLTDVEIANTSRFDVDVAIELSSVPVSAPLFFTLSPGQSQRFPDIIGQAFGLDGALSPLRITASRRGGVQVRAFAYAIGGGTIGPPQPIQVYGSDTYFPVRILDGLSFSDAYRTNIGLVNAGEQPADFLLALQRIPGRNVDLARIRVAPYGIEHIAIQALFPTITNGSGFSVVVETDARDTHVYASVVESATNSGKSVTPRVGAR
jgi:hypothetical protein